MIRVPSPIDGQASELFSYRLWRERFLNVILQGSCILGFLAIVLYFFTPSIPLYKALAVVSYGVLLLLTYVRGLPYSIRAGAFLLLLYFAGFTSLLDHGIADAALLFLGFIVMTGLLFSPRAGIYVTISLVTFGIMLFYGWERTDLLDLARLTAIFVVVLSIIITGLHTFQEEFTRAQQTARESLESLRAERSNLELRVEERTAGLTRKTDQLRATSYIARKTAEVQDLATLLNMVANLVADQFGFYHTGIFLISETGEEAVLQATSSEGGARMIERGHALAVGTQGVVGFVAAQKKPRITLDVGEDAVFFNNPDLPMTRSELALPLMIHNRILGVLDIQSDKPQAFGVDDIDVLQTLADHVAIAIENARLLDESQSTLTQLEALTSLRTREVWSQKLREKNRVFTYTPLGLRAEKLSSSTGKTISVPLMLRGQKIGSISISRRGDSALSKRDEELISEVAGQAGLAIDNIRLLEEATQRAHQEQIVGKLAGRFSQSLDTDTLLQTAVRELAQLSDVTEVSIFVGKQAGDPLPNRNGRRTTG
jgi:GAF domain-containing protein